MIERLQADPGHRTLGELLQERQWAVHEISRLRAEIIRLSSRGQRVVSVERARDAGKGQPAADPAMVRRFVRLGEVCKLVGLSRSTIYQMKQQGLFPEAVKLGARSVAWRMADIIAWQDRRAAV